MVEHMIKSQNAQDEITTILYEEVQACFTGDKDAAETARLIQNRVQLYLDENMQ